MNITKGFWCTRDGRKVEVVDVRNTIAIGWIGNRAYIWTNTGLYSEYVKTDIDLVEPWIDKPEWNWSTTPPWFNWLAMDKDRVWYLFATKPNPIMEKWFPSEGATFLIVPPQYAPKWTGDWKDSRISRPGI